MAKTGLLIDDMSSQLDDKAFYNLNDILEKDADYNVIFGERGNGKTYAVLQYALERFVNSKKSEPEQLAIVRRMKEDVIGRRANQMFMALVANGEVKRLTNGNWSDISYYNGRWYLSKYNPKLDKMVREDTPLAFSFALSDMEHDKSTSYPFITTILFDEFITRRYYLPDEFILFTNVISTIIRERDNAKIFMCGNTVNRFCPYFKEMGLYKASTMEQGTIDVYSYGESDLTVAVEYCENVKTEKKSNKYFAFDNENLKMITKGKWELQIYPHLSESYKKEDIVFTYFIEWGKDYLQCDIVQNNVGSFTYIHEKTTPLHNPDEDLVYSLEYSEKANYKRRLLASSTKLETKIARYYALGKVFFQNNEVGEIVNNYIHESEKFLFAKI